MPPILERIVSLIARPAVLSTSAILVLRPDDNFSRERFIAREFLCMILCPIMAVMSWFIIIDIVITFLSECKYSSLKKFPPASRVLESAHAGGCNISIA